MLKCFWNKPKQKPSNMLLTSDSNITSFWPTGEKLSDKTGTEPKAPRPAPKERSANHEGSGTNSASNLPAKERQIVAGHYGRSCATGEREREREKKPCTIWANEESKGRKEAELHISRVEQKRSSTSNTFRKLSSYSVNVVLCALSVSPCLPICSPSVCAALQMRYTEEKRCNL
jgi:hypothetical protein